MSFTTICNIVFYFYAIIKPFKILFFHLTKILREEILTKLKIKKKIRLKACQYVPPHTELTYERDPVARWHLLTYKK